LPEGLRQRFGRSRRLLQPAEFQRVFSAREAWSSDDLLTILASPNELGEPRLGLAIAKKHVRHAVGRNRIKRQARECFRLNQTNLPAVDLIVLAKKPAASASPARLRASIERHLQRITKRCSS